VRLDHVKIMFLRLLLLMTFFCSSVNGVLDVQCRYEGLSSTGRVICECTSLYSSSSDYEDLTDTIYNFVNNQFRSSLSFSTVALNNCKSIKITVDFTSLGLLSAQKISYISFENIDNLEVYLTNLDIGDKTVVTEDIDFLSLSGRMYEDSASLRFFLRQSSSLLFNDFYATTPISLINVQDVNSLRVIDSGVESVAIAEFIRVTSCQNEDGISACSRNLFPEDGWFVADTETILLIVGITFLIVAIIVGIGVAFYIRRWKKKKDLELLGFPPKPVRAPPPAPRSEISRTSANGVKIRY